MYEGVVEGGCGGGDGWSKKGNGMLAFVGVMGLDGRGGGGGGVSWGGEGGVGGGK